MFEIRSRVAHVLLFLVVIFMTPFSSEGAINNPVTWIPSAVTEKLQYGQSRDVIVTFMSTQPLSSVKIIPDAVIQSYASISPNVVMNVRANTRYSVTVHLFVPQKGQSGQYAGNIILKGSSGILGGIGVVSDVESHLPVRLDVMYNQIPVANAGLNQAALVKSLILLDGSKSSDLEGDPLTYSWQMISKPLESSAALSGSTVERPVFVADKVGVYIITLSVSDGKNQSSPARVQVTVTLGGIKLQGVSMGFASDKPAIDALTTMLPVAADQGDIQDGIIMTRLHVWLAPGATVGQVNAALWWVNGGIISMLPGVPMITISIPKPVSMDALDAVIRALKQPGISMVDKSILPALMEMPGALPGKDYETIHHDLWMNLDYLAKVRFHAAWHVRNLALANCTVHRIPVLIADHFDRPNAVPAFIADVPNFNLFPPWWRPGEIHGLTVASVLTAKYDELTLTGANPFPQCLDLMGIQVAGMGWYDILLRISSILPNEKFILNASLGFDNACHGPCTPNYAENHFLHGPATAAMQAALWKSLTHTRWQDFMSVTVAGNEANKPATSIYPGFGKADFSSPLGLVSQTDIYFNFVTDAYLWNPQNGYPLYPSLIESPDVIDVIREYIDNQGLNTVGPADNVLIVGSAQDDPTYEFFPDSPFSNTPYSATLPYVRAVGEKIGSYWGYTQGTSFAAPQVAGLAAYMWLLSPELRNQPSSITKRAIMGNTRDTDQGKNLIDAYASVLSLDRAETPTSASVPLRFALLDVNGDRKFDENDIQQFLSYYIDSSTNQPVDPWFRDFSRYDLNGDGYTGGAGKDRFDLDRTGSTQYGAAMYSTVDQQIEGQTVSLNESALTDMDILCYYAYSGLYKEGILTDADKAQRKDLLAERCSPIRPICPGPNSGNYLQILLGACPRQADLYEGNLMSITLNIAGNSGDASAAAQYGNLISQANFQLNGLADNCNRNIISQISNRDIIVITHPDPAMNYPNGWIRGYIKAQYRVNVSSSITTQPDSQLGGRGRFILVGTTCSAVSCTTGPWIDTFYYDAYNTGDPSGVHEFQTWFVFGMPFAFDFNTTLYAGVNSNNIQSPMPVNVNTLMNASVQWIGIAEVGDANGNLLTDYATCSASGTAY